MAFRPGHRTFPFCPAPKSAILTAPPILVIPSAVEGPAVAFAFVCAFAFLAVFRVGNLLCLSPKRPTGTIPSTSVSTDVVEIPANRTLVKRLWPILCVVGLLSQLSLAQRSPSCSTNEDSPSDVTIQLAPDRGQTVFRQGEIIRLTFRYTSRSPKKYLLNNRNYDRSGRLDGVDELCLQPDTGTDPLDDYFHSYGGFIGGGLSSDQQISTTPVTSNLDLNEWTSLQPGTYTLSILSHRISMGDESDYKTWNHDAIPVRSNSITFQVVSAEPAWQSSVLNNAVKTLNSPRSTEEERENAARALRFLNSEEAARELARRFWMSAGNLRWEFEAGLYGNPYRRTAIQAMRAVLRDSHGVSRDWFIDLLVNLEMQSDPRFRQFRYGSESAENEDPPSSTYASEHNRRVAKYSLKVATGTFR